MFRNGWLMTAASEVHVCNYPDRFLEFTPASEPGQDGPSEVTIMGYGKVCLRIRDGNGEAGNMVLENVAYIPGFRTNLVLLPN